VMAATPPRERTVVEGNLVEHPIWKLNNRQARPKRVAVDASTGEPREYVEPEDYTQTFELGPHPADSQRRRQLVMRADVHAGFPTMHAFRVLLVVIERAHQLGYAGQKVPITPTEIALGLGAEEPGGKDYRSIYGSLDALENVQLCFVESFYDRTARMVHPGRLTERLVKKTRFRLRARPTAAAAAPTGVAGEVEPGDFVELGDALWRSLTSGYRFAVDRAYLNALPTELAQRLYSYLSKKDRASRFYEERVISLGRHLGLAMIKAANELCPECGPTVDEVRNDMVRYKGHTARVAFLGRWCRRCGEAVLDGPALQARQQAFFKLRAKVEGVPRRARSRPSASGSSCHSAVREICWAVAPAHSRSTSPASSR
jgi:YgiT-type zinc finger domain-containing protein